jgi:hypothetical protein
MFFNVRKTTMMPQHSPANLQLTGLEGKMSALSNFAGDTTHRPASGLK